MKAEIFSQETLLLKLTKCLTETIFFTEIIKENIMCTYRAVIVCCFALCKRGVLAMKMTELAKLAGVNVSTISKAFSGGKGVSPELRERIFELARQHGCYDKYCKLPYKGMVVGVICCEFESRYYSEILSCLSRKLRERGAIINVSDTDYSKENFEELLEYYSDHVKVDGIVLVSSGSKIDRNFSIPIISLGGCVNFNSIIYSEEKASYDAIKHFKDNGHRKIAYIGETWSIPRLKNFINSMKANDIPIEEKYVITSKERLIYAGYNEMNKLLELPDPPTAVLAAYDNIAIGAMKCIYDHGLKIPEDISIIGADDTREASYLPCSLTSITAYNDDLIDITLDVLFDLIERKDSSSKKKIKVLKELVVRDSVAKAKESS